ncbi:arsenate reductase [Chitinivorax tropicus]|uniref:Arsenate reductase n=1 Tax=Chitinivorax tropicus TaxID=714531 RepID=A0A840MM92_9PROT|nr:arsenate reductase ArsC [Chitinivorax tropicus]MBB5018047.1 arsenate reductase [Chitinivorax tropicus]
MTDKTYHILVLCTGNSARSIMAEALINILGQGRFRAFSAGSHPTGKVNPFAVEQVAVLGYPTDALRSKSWDEFTQPDAPAMDFILTVCDNAAGEVCPVWPGQPVAAHWGFEDPAAVVGSDEYKREAFHTICQQIRRKVEQLMKLQLDELDLPAIKQALQTIGNQPV